MLRKVSVSMQSYVQHLRVPNVTATTALAVTLVCMCSFVLYEQQQTLVTKKTLRSLDPFASISNSYQSRKNLQGILRPVNDQTFDFENNGTLI